MNQVIFQKVSFFSNFPIMAMSFLLPLYCLELGFSPIETTGLFAVVSFALIISKLLIGDLCDKRSRKKIFCAGLLLKALSYGLLAYLQSRVPLYIAQALKGIATSLISVSMYTMMSDNRESSFAVRQAKISSSEGKGELLGVLICWLLLTVTDFSNGWKYLFLISMAFAVYAAFFSYKTLVESNKSVSDNQRLPNRFTKLFVINVFYSFATVVVDVIIVLYLSKKYTVNNGDLALILLIPAAIIAYISPALGRFIEKIKEKKRFI